MDASPVEFVIVYGSIQIFVVFWVSVKYQVVDGNHRWDAALFDVDGQFVAQPVEQLNLVA